MRLGIYGGTYSPPHFGHIRAAEEFIRAMNLDKLLIMPAFIPPHKAVKSGDNPTSRLEMCRLAFGDIPNCEVCSYEIDKGGVSYTADTLEYFTGKGDELFLLCGTDMFLTLDKWRRPEVIFSLAHVVGIRRDSISEAEMNRAAAEYALKYGAETTVLHTSPLEISSTEIRERLSRGEDTEDILPKEVAEYIVKNGLYK